jgi:UDP-glucose 4-epimerase
VGEDNVLNPLSPYGRSKLMTEMMLADVAAAHPFTYGALRYFNVAGADPKKRSGQSTPEATHLIKVTAQAALGQRDSVGIFGTDFPTPDGTGVRDYIHVTDLVEAHALLLGLSACRWREHGVQLRLRHRILGAAGDRHGAQGLRRRLQGGRGAAAAG